MTSPHPRPSRLFDRAGALWAALCAVHCVALPLVFVVVPSLAASLYSFHAAHHALAIALLRVISWEPWFIAVSVTVSSIAIGHGVHWHRRWSPALLASAGAASLAVGWFLRLYFGGWLHLIGVVCGGTLLVSAHLWNLRLLARMHRH